MEVRYKVTPAEGWLPSKAHPTSLPNFTWLLKQKFLCGVVLGKRNTSSNPLKATPPTNISRSKKFQFFSLSLSLFPLTMKLLILSLKLFYLNFGGKNLLNFFVPTNSSFWPQSLLSLFFWKRFLNCLQKKKKRRKEKKKKRKKEDCFLVCVEIIVL